jgi:hypothetical protein
MIFKFCVKIDNNCISYYRYRKRHRINSPAVIYDNGELCWFQYGELHREDGPAVSWKNSNIKVWCLRGHEMDYLEFLTHINRLC